MTIMEKLKKAYYYFFYKIYKSIEYTSELVGGAFWTDFKTGLALIALELWFSCSILNYYAIITSTRFSSTTLYSILLIPLIFFSLINYFAFIKTDLWKEYNKQFDKLPETENRKGTIIVCILIGFIIINFFCSLFLLQKYLFKP